MAAPKKKRAICEEIDCENKDSSDESGSENEEMMEEDEGVNEVIEVEFEAHEPNAGDFDGIKRLLQQLFLKAHVDLSALSDLIIQQNYVGNVIKQSEIPEDTDDDEEDVTFGITTVINITERQELPCIQQFKKLILDLCNRHGSLDSKKFIENLLQRNKSEKHHVGFLINERFVNIPSKIAGPALESLIKDVGNAAKRNKCFNFDYIMMISKVYKLKTSTKRETVETTVYPKSEEEIFKEEALTFFEYSISGEADSGLQDDWDAEDEGMAPFHQVLIIPSEKLEGILCKIKSMT